MLWAVIFKGVERPAQQICLAVMHSTNDALNDTGRHGVVHCSGLFSCSAALACQVAAVLTQHHC
jgi:hypothetical protein